MALFIRDDEVDALAEEAKALLKAPSKKEAVRQALEEIVRQHKEKLPLRDRLQRSMDLARAIGPKDPDFDMKKFMDEMWGDED